MWVGEGCKWGGEEREERGGEENGEGRRLHCVKECGLLKSGMSSSVSLTIAGERGEVGGWRRGVKREKKGGTNWIGVL